MSETSALVKTRALLADPDVWTKGTRARRADGSSTLASDPDAVCWSLCAALDVVGTPEEERRLVNRAVAAMAGTIIAIHVYNDREGTTHADILETLDRAIEADGMVTS